ncbi:MAG: hypothetical protein F6K28_40925, partial [Microcoleus sp. SIO2G3]|nr:hypothetical protein [Microcoleus sp. SIO2G3]
NLRLIGASLLYEARQSGRNISWVQVEFEKEARQVPKPIFNVPNYARILVIGIGGVMIVILMVLVVIGVLNQTRLWELLQNLFGK